MPSTRPEAILSSEREIQVLELRVQGKTLREIAELIGMSKSGVHQALERILGALAEENLEKVDRLRSLELERLERLGAAWFKRAQIDEKAAATYLRIASAKAKLCGLNAPTRISVEPARELSDAELITRAAPLVGQLSAVLGGDAATWLNSVTRLALAAPKQATVEATVVSSCSVEQTE